MIRMENSPVKASANLAGMGQSLDDQRYPHVIGERMTNELARVDVDDCGQIHVLAALTRQVGDVAYIDLVRLISGEFTAY